LDESKKSRSVNRLIINQYENIISFLDKYSILTRKYLDYLDWKKIIELKSNNTHKTTEGLQHMINLKIGMNKGKLLNSNLLCNSDRLKVVNWSNLYINKKSYHTKVDKDKKNIFSFFFLFNLFFIECYKFCSIFIWL
jgi:LAGLIDADG endonuclease